MSAPSAAPSLTELDRWRDCTAALATDVLPTSAATLPAVNKSPRSHRGFHVVAPSQRPHNEAERATMSLPKDPKTIGERIATALGRRIGYGVTRKQLQRALNISSGTVDNLLSGHQDPSPRVFMALLQFFDAAFAHEVLAASGFTLVKLSDVRAAEAAQKMIEGARVLAELQRGIA